MAAATLALRAAIHAALLSDTALRAALGGPRIYDTLPREAAFPYVLLGYTRLSDASGDAAPLQEHLLTLHAWSRQGGQHEAHAVADHTVAAGKQRQHVTQPRTRDDHRLSPTPDAPR